MRARTAATMKAGPARLPLEKIEILKPKPFDRREVQTIPRVIISRCIVYNSHARSPLMMGKSADLKIVLTILSTVWLIRQTTPEYADMPLSLYYIIIIPAA